MVVETWKGHSEKLVMGTANQEERQNWINAISSAIESFVKRPTYTGRCFCGSCVYEIAGII